MNKGDLPGTSQWVTVQTAVAGATFTPFGAQPCLFARVHAPAAADLDVQKDGQFLTIKAGFAKTFLGVDNMSKLAVRRNDQSAVQLAVTGEAMSQ